MEDLLCTEETLFHPLTFQPDPIIVLQCMLTRETQYDPCNPAYLVHTQRHGMEASWRRKICQWMFETGNAFELTKDTVACAILFMDRYLSSISVDKVMLQLVSMISMMISSKMHDHQPISMEEMELLSQSKFRRDEIRRAESEMIQFLTWQLNPPTSFTFARDFIQCLDGIHPEIRVILEDDVTDLLQDATLDYMSLRFPNSILGIATVQVVWNTKNFGLNSILYNAMHVVAVGRDPVFEDCLRWLRVLYEAKHEPQTRFVSVEMEESKFAESVRSISPTSVDHMDEFTLETRQYDDEVEDEGYEEDDEDDVDLKVMGMVSQGKIRPTAPSPELQRPVPSKRSRLHYEQ